jgi:predicted DNA-binding antitoxin AbrB/MazE fold protein
MTQTIRAIYENGVLRPLTPVEGLAEHATVTVSIDAHSQPHPLLKFCGTVSDEDTREIGQIIAREFDKVDLNEWK